MTKTPWGWEGEGESDLVKLTTSDGRTTYVTQETLDAINERYKERYNQARPEQLGAVEQRELSETIGIPVSTWSEAKAAMRERNIRFVEKGDNRDRWERERKEWIADGKQGPQPTPNATVMGHMKSPNIRKLLKEMGHEI